jgi:hypothetical protein
MSRSVNNNFYARLSLVVATFFLPEFGAMKQAKN